MTDSIQLVSIGFDQSGIEVFAPQNKPRPSAKSAAPNQDEPYTYGFWAWFAALALLSLSIIARGYFNIGA